MKICCSSLKIDLSDHVYDRKAWRLRPRALEQSYNGAITSPCSDMRPTQCEPAP